MKLLSVRDAAKILGITDSLVRRMIRNKKIPAQRLGERSFAIDPKDLAKVPKVRKPGPKPGKKRGGK